MTEAAAYHEVLLFMEARLRQQLTRKQVIQNELSEALSLNAAQRKHTAREVVIARKTLGDAQAKLSKLKVRPAATL